MIEEMNSMNKTVCTFLLSLTENTREWYNAFKKINNVEIDYLIKKKTLSVKPSFITEFLIKLDYP